MTISAAQMKIPTVPLTNASFATPVQTGPRFLYDPPDRYRRRLDVHRDRRNRRGGQCLHEEQSADGGTQVGFITSGGSISQSVKLNANTPYAVSFLVAEQQLDNGSISKQTLQVKLGSKVIGTFKPTATVGGGYVLFTSDAFKESKAGTYQARDHGYQYDRNQYGADRQGRGDGATAPATAPPAGPTLNAIPDQQVTAGTIDTFTANASGSPATRTFSLAPGARAGARSTRRPASSPGGRPPAGTTRSPSRSATTPAERSAMSSLCRSRSLPPQSSSRDWAEAATPL